jgi:hypothetical protein
MTIRRRNNAPIRPRPGAPVAADFAFALAGGAFTMAAIFVVVSFQGTGFAGTGPGADLARLFAGSLGVAGLAAALIGVLLVAGTPEPATHVVAPAAIGAVIGALQSLLLLQAAPLFMPLPLALLVLVPARVRRGLFGRRGR